MRTGIISEYGLDGGVDPFMASFPHLIDVGIMGHCIHGKTGLCLKAGVHCYQSSLTVEEEPNITLEDFVEIARQCKGRVNQFAWSGRGTGFNTKILWRSWRPVLITTSSRTSHLRLRSDPGNGGCRQLLAARLRSAGIATTTPSGRSSSCLTRVSRPIFTMFWGKIRLTKPITRLETDDFQRTY